MRWAGRTATVLVALCLLLSGAVGVGSALTTDEARSAHDVATVRLTQTFATLSEPGVVRATYEFHIPESVETLSTRVPSDATAISTSGGFEHDSGDRYTWEGGSMAPSITFRWPVNETATVTGPEGADGRYRFVDVGAWGLFARPPVPIDVTYYGDGVEFIRETAVDGPGVAGQWLVFIGDATIHRQSAANQQFTVVEPAAADLAVNPGNLLSALGDAAGALQVGSRDTTVLAVAAPTTVDWAVEGLAVGAGDFYVTADEPLDEPDNTWLHEYVHTRQSFNFTRETRWVTEATATYYAALLSLEQDLISFDAFRDHLSTGTWDRFEDDVLSEPSTWTAGVNYRKGGLVIGDLDRRIRLSTDRRRSFQAVFSELNTRPDPLDGDVFVDLVTAAGTAADGDVAKRFSATTATPDVWDREAHAAAFDQLPARISVNLNDRFDVFGPYRNRSIGGDPLVVVPGERLVANVTVENAGGTHGSYEFAYGLVETEFQSVSGTVAPGETVQERLAVEIDRVGRTTVRIDTFERPISVLEPATPTVAGIQSNRSTVAAGDAVAVAIEIRNGEVHPGQRMVTVAANGEPVENITVRLEGSETVTRIVPVRLIATGMVTITAGERSVDVQVTASQAGDRTAVPRSDTTMTATPGGEGPGFGPIMALLGLLVAVMTSRAGER